MKITSVFHELARVATPFPLSSLGRALALLWLGSFAAPTNVSAQPVDLYVTGVFAFPYPGVDGNVANTLLSGTDGNLYGTTQVGGTANAGTVFRINMSGTPLNVLGTFTGSGGAFPGSTPMAGLIRETNGVLYGTTSRGGAHNFGNVFSMTTNGTAHVLGSFTGTNGAFPGAACIAPLFQGSDGYLYGTCSAGGSNGYGTVFKISTNGVATVLASFTGTNGAFPGAAPQGGLIQARDGYFYGTAYAGGSNGAGVAFKISTNGIISNLVSFTSPMSPYGGLIQGQDGNFYGTAGSLPYSLPGCVFGMTSNGVVTNLYTFSSVNGSKPNGGLIQGSDGLLYGTTMYGGTDDSGTVFQMTTNGLMVGLGMLSTNANSPESGLIETPSGRYYGTSPFYNSASYYGDVYEAYPLVTFVSPPVNQTNVAGTTAHFSVGLTRAVSGYQWLKNGTNLTNGGNLSGVLSSQLTISNVSDSDMGTYNLVVNYEHAYLTNFYPATLTVVDPPVITSQPANQTNSEATTAVFGVSAQGLFLNYQWIRNSSSLANGGNISGANSTNLTISMVSLSDVGSYSVIISNAAGVVTSSVATLTLGYRFPTATGYTAAPAIAAGQGHALALRSDGSVWAWGNNDYWQLGVPTVPFADFPMRVVGVSGVSAIAAGAAHSLAISNGTVWAWGANESGQLGTGNTIWSAIPVKVVGITNAVAVAGGGYQGLGSHSLALLANGTVMAWGYNSYGQLGNGTFATNLSPAAVAGLSNVMQISAGAWHSMALTSNGQVWCWGEGNSGQIGNGTNLCYSNATLTLNLSNIVAIAAGGAHSLALKSDGTVWSWGYNADGELGQGNTNNSATATQIAGLSNVIAIGASTVSSAATVAPTFLTGTNAQTMTWGYQIYENGFNEDFTSPYTLGQAPPFVQLALGYEANANNDYYLGLTASGSIYAWGVNDQAEFGNGNFENPDENPSTFNFLLEPTLSFTATPVARCGEFIRGNLDKLDYCTIVVPIDLEQAVPLNAFGNDQYSFTNSRPWFLSTFNQPLYLPIDLAGGTNLVTFPMGNPMVAFGSQGNGSPLFVNHPYSFGVYAGGMDESTSASANVIQISVYDATKFTNGVTANMVPTNVFTIALPQRTVTAQSNAWYSFMSNGAAVTFTSNGLTTTISFLDDGYTNDEPFGLSWYSSNGLAPQMTNFDLVAYKITHTASATNYFYTVAVLGKVQVATNLLAPMATNAAGVWTAAPLYTLDFQQPTPLQSMYVDRLFFQGTPMPPTYENAARPGPTGLTTMVTNIVSLTSTNYTNIDTSPELRRSPILDQFVLDMNKDPLALASYVVNEIGLTDPYAAAQLSQVVAANVNCGGIDRSAQSTFLEGQGSPIEQCALLVYLLRQAGYPAAYVFPTNGNLYMSDTHISQLWRMQVSGVVNVLGIPYVTNSFLTVDYPWVVANIGTNTVHIFPWIKDTAIVQGVNLYDYMPANYNTALAWVEQYVRANPSIMSLNSENLPSALFPAFVQQCLLTNAEGASISLDDVGVTAYDRPHQFPSWSYLPQPDYVTNLNTLSIVDSLNDSAVTYPFLSNMFNTAEVQVYNVTGSSSNLLMDTGVWDSCDFHDRKLLIFTNNNQVCLWMEPYRGNISTVQTFSAGIPSSTALLSNSVAASGITNLAVYVIHKRRVAYLSQPADYFPLVETRGSTNVSHCFTFEVAGIALDYGRVSTPMLQPYEDFYWNLQRERAASNSFVPPVWDYQGTAAYLLAMCYFQKNDAFDALNQQWHGVRGLVHFSSGLGTVGNSAQTNMQARVDMIIGLEEFIANASLRPDGGVPDFSAVENYETMSVVNGSAQEHDILQTMFPDQNAVSTVRLLQLAQLQATNGNSPILELVNNNYIAQGNVSHAGYGSTALKNISPPVWAIVTNSFGQSDAPYDRVLMTPGLVTNATASFGGMGALTLNYTAQTAVISSNSIVFNGGAGGVVTSFTPVAPSVNYPLLLVLTANGDPSFLVDNATGTIIPVLSPLDIASVPTTSGTIVPTTSQDNTASVEAIQTGQAPPTTSQLTLFDLLVAADNGLAGPALAWQRSYGQPVNDPVDPVSGGFYVDATDLILPGPLPLELRRNYLSQNPSANNFGSGWKMNFMPYLVVTTNTGGQSVIYGAELDGVVIAYHQTNSGGPWVVLPQDNPSLNNNSTGSKGGTANMFNAVLNLYPTNGNTYIVSAPDGSIRTYQQMTFAIVGGTNTMNRTRPYLTQWQDHFGNYAQFLYGTNSMGDDYGQLNRINMANGNDLVFKYDFYGRIIQAFTGDGRFVTYQYDNYGDLVNVVLPDNTQCQYQYQHYSNTTNGITYTDSTHLMSQEIKPDGRIVANAYDSFNRVTTQASTVGTNLVLVTNGYFFYTNNATNLANQFITGSTGVQDVFHNPTVYYYTSNLITSTVDPFGYFNTQIWFPDTPNGASGYYPRSLQYTIDKRGLTNQFFYSSSGCVTQLVVSGNLTGEGVANQTATSTYAYTAKNLPSIMSDSVNNGMQFAYDTADPFKLTQAVRTSGATAVSTKFYFYTNVSQLSSVGTTNYAFGLLSRQVDGGATNDFAYNGQGFLTEQIQYAATTDDPADTDPNVTTLFNYNERGQCYQQQIVGGALTQMDFDPLGRMTSRQVFDQNNNKLSSEFFYYNLNGELSWYDGPRTKPEDYVYYVYDGAGRVIQEIHWRSQGMLNGAGVQAPAGNALYATTFKTFDGFGNNTSITDPRGVVVTNLCDALGRVLQSQVIDANGSLLKTEKFAYEKGGKVMLATNALGGVTQTLYAQTGQPYFQQNPDGSTNGWAYYLDGRVKKEFLPNGNFWLVTYDDVNLLTTRTFYSGGTALATNVTGFDRRGNQTLRVDALGNHFTSVFDGMNRVKSASGPAVTNQTSLASGFGNGSQINVVQRTSSNNYDAAGLMTTSFNALGESTVTYKDALGRPTDVEVHDAANNLVRIATTAYSADHQSETVTEGIGATAIVKTVYTDNADKPVLTISYPSAGAEEFVLDQYDAAENLISQTHNTASGTVVTTWTVANFVVDGLNRVVSKTDRDGAVTTYAFDGASDPTNRVMPGRVSWQATYNSARQTLYDCEISSNSLVTRSNSYTYNSTTGLLQTGTDGRGVTCTRYYDAFLRPASNVYSGSLPEQDMATIISYDARSVVTNIAENFASNTTGVAVSVGRTFDAYNDLVSDTINGGNSYTAAQAWDAAGRRIGLGMGSFGYAFTHQADGLVTSVTGPPGYGGGTYTYSLSGLLTSRNFSPRATTITQFDGDGRPLAATTTVNGTNVLTENLTFTPNGLLATHTLGRPDFTDNRSYGYANLSRRLSQEAVGVSSTSNWVNTFVYDNGVFGGPGVLTSMGQATGTNALWKGGADSFSRVSAATNTVTQRTGYGFLNGSATLTALLDSNSVPVTSSGTNDSYQWQSQLSLTPGAHQLVVHAVNWSGFYTASATNTFTNNAADRMQQFYAGNGLLTNQVWIKANGQTNATKSFSWDARDRLHTVTYRDSNTNGYIWSAVYDPLGRRVSTTAIYVTNGITLTNVPQSIAQYFDPQVQFLEVGEADGGSNTWKFYGPDVNGTYGGMHGMGGLEAIANQPYTSCPVVNDARGNALALSGPNPATLTWFPSRISAFGAVPGFAPLPLGGGASVAQASAFRHKWADITGLYWHGNRYYDPVSGTWLSFDPEWNAADCSGFTLAGGDPVNYYDPMGLIETPLQGMDRVFSSYNFPGKPGTGYSLSAFNQIAGPDPSQYDAFDVEFAKNVANGTSLYPFGRLSPLELQVAANRGYMSSWDMPAIYGQDQFGTYVARTGGQLAQDVVGAALFSAAFGSVFGAVSGEMTPAAKIAQTFVSSEGLPAETTATQLEFPFARGASVQTPGATTAGETFVRVGAGPQNLKFGSTSLSGAQPGTYAFPEETFNAVGQDPAVLKNLGDLPGSPPQYFRILQPPAGTPIQRGIVPGGQFGGSGGAQEVIFPKGF